MIPGEQGSVACGVCYNADDAGNFDYLYAVEVSDFSRLGPESTRLRIPAGRYAGIPTPESRVLDP